MNYCEECGKPINEDALLCDECAGWEYDDYYDNDWIGEDQ